MYIKVCNKSYRARILIWIREYNTAADLLCIVVCTQNSTLNLAKNYILPNSTKLTGTEL